MQTGYMMLSNLQTKDIVNVVDGRKIGNIIDVKIDSNTGKLLKLLVEPSKNFKKFFSSREESEIMWEAIVKIGEDVILVNIEI